MRFVSVNGHIHHYALEGPEDAPTVVFANSLGTDFRIWNDVLAHLSGPIRSLRYDMRGHGLSDLSQGPVTIADLADDLLTLLDHLKIGQAHVVGLSIGGMVAQALATQAPGRITSLVLCDTAHRIGTPDAWGTRIAAIEAGGLESIADAVLDRWFAPELRTANPGLFAGARAMLTRTPATGYQALCAAIRDADLTASTALIETRTLCLCGTADMATPPELVAAMADLMPNAVYESIPGAGHLPCLERPAFLAAKLEEFWQSAGDASA